MVIAIPYNNENGEVGQHFGKADFFKFYELDDYARLVDSFVAEPTGKGHTAVCDFLMSHNVEIVICRHLGQEALDILQANEIAVYVDAEGPADEIIVQLVDAALEQATTANCGGGCAGGCCGGSDAGADCGCGGCCH